MEHRKQNGDDSCDMCMRADKSPLDLTYELPSAGTTFSSRQLSDVRIIKNDFPYENFDGRFVVTHHMLLPVEHYSTASTLPDAVKQEFRNTLDTLLDNGIYDAVYTRSTYSPTSSRPGHLHAHLFKFGGKVKRQLYEPAEGRNEIEFEA